MSSIPQLPSLLPGVSWRSPSHHGRSHRNPQNDPANAARLALVRSLFSSAAPSGTPTAPGTGLPTGAPFTGNPLEGNLGNLIDLRATMVTRTEDASLTIKTAEGDTVTLTEHAQRQALDAQFTYAPGSAPASQATAGGSPAQGQATPVNDDHDRDEQHGGSSVGLREIQLDRSTTVSVQGDLSQQELADIKQLVAGLRDSLKSLGAPDSGQGQGGAMAAATSITRMATQGLGSLAAFELHVEQTVDTTRIHVHRAPAPPVTATLLDPTGSPPPVAGVPDAPVAADPPIAPVPGHAPAAGKPPVLGRAIPAAPSQPGTPAWVMDMLHTHGSTRLDVMFRRPSTAPQPAQGTLAPLPESPAATS
jgi:hypothetical protein